MKPLPLLFAFCSTFFLHTTTALLGGRNSRDSTSHNTRSYLEDYRQTPDTWESILMKSYLKDYNRQASKKCSRASNANWKFSTDMTEENERLKWEASKEYTEYDREFLGNLSSKFKKGWHNFEDPDLRRMLKKVSSLGVFTLPEKELEEVNELKSNMTKIFTSVKVCSLHDETNQCGLSLNPDLKNIMRESRDEKELRHVWTEWHDRIGKQDMKRSYQRLAELTNQVAKLNDFKDAGEHWLQDYESETFKEDVEQLWQTIKPLYIQIHAYVAAKLRKIYPDQFTDDGLIPVHLLGNMLSQSWKEIYPLMVPFPENVPLNITEQMNHQGYTPLKMFQMSDEFSTSLGMIPVPQEFWEESMIEKPIDRNVDCQASAWDFCNGKDFRIKQCTAVTIEDFITVHHEMGHVQYYLQYKDQPIFYRRGANPGFHEAVGATIGLSVQSPKHLKRIGLLGETIDEYQISINSLFSMALEKIVFLPYAYIMDKYRWGIFDGSINPSNYNSNWWKLRKEYQGVKPPSDRSEDHFDAAAKYHLTINIDYIKYFVSTITQFQLHRSLCVEAEQYDKEDHTKSLNNCDIYKSKEAGSKLAAGLKMGSSKPWPEVLQVITGQDKMDASAIREYFKPLEDWLALQNHEMGNVNGWGSDYDDSLTLLHQALTVFNTTSTSNDVESSVRSYLEDYNHKASEKCFQSVQANWNYLTDINEENEKLKLEANLDYLKFDQEFLSNLTERFETEWTNIRDPDLYRQFEKVTLVGSSVLPENELTELNQVKLNMSKIYRTTKVCSYQDENRCDLSLNPELTKIMQESRDEKELRHIWIEWHNKSGNEVMKKSYQRFVELTNQVAKLNDFDDAGAYDLHAYESETFKNDVEHLYQTLKPFYNQIHAYVRSKLRKLYPDQFTVDDGLIPAHLLGNMWGQSWENIYSLTAPFPEKRASIDVTEQLKQQGYTPLTMFRKSEEFYTSLGLIPVPAEFWAKSMFEKPKEKDVACHASAWDFCNGKDFRIKQCTTITTEDFIKIHNEMGHIQYFLQYKDLPIPYRRGANPAFYEAVSNALGLSVQTPKHLKEIGLLDEAAPVYDYEYSINFLFSMALEKIAFLPFAYIMDKYRWDVYEGSIDPSNYNSNWWKLRKEYQGIKAPLERTEDHFDAPVEYNLSANIENFTSIVLQFQLYKSLCQEAGQYDHQDPSSKPLNNCDVYGSKEAGSKLAAGLKMGSSKPWPEVLQVITGQDKMDASAIREYFKPLEDWLSIQNVQMDEIPGWRRN